MGAREESVTAMGAEAIIDWMARSVVHRNR